MGMAIAAAGSLAGGLAGGALMNALAGPAPEPDTTIPGVTAATIKKGGKGKPDEKVAQVDVSQALNWMQQAAKEQENSYLQGLGFYSQALGEAGTQIVQGFNQANSTLTPLSSSANAALNEQMRMMGLDPIPATQGIEQEISTYSNDLARQIEAANKLQDPQQRAIAKQDILNGINSLIQEVPKDTPKPSLYVAQEMPDNVWRSRQQHAEWDAKEAAKVAASQQAIDEWQQQQPAQALQTYQAALKNNSLTNLANKFSSQYGTTFDKGYTGEQITDRITATPGYNFQLNQGTDALVRQKNALGMLGSGNTLTALTEFGQNLATNYYGAYMDNLSKIVQQGSGATQAIANNQSTQGQLLGKLAEAGGQAYLSTYGAIGDAKANSLYNQANMYSQAAQFNATMQQHGLDALADRQMQMQQSAMNLLPAMQANNLNQSKFNYQVAQNQQAGAQYFAPSSGEGQTYQMGGLTFPDYSGVKV